MKKGRDQKGDERWGEGNIFYLQKCSQFIEVFCVKITFTLFPGLLQLCLPPCLLWQSGATRIYRPSPLSKVSPICRKRNNQRISWEGIYIFDPKPKAFPKTIPAKVPKGILMGDQVGATVILLQDSYFCSGRGRMPWTLQCFVAARHWVSTHHISSFCGGNFVLSLRRYIPAMMCEILHRAVYA